MSFSRLRLHCNLKPDPGLRFGLENLGIILKIGVRWVELKGVWLRFWLKNQNPDSGFN